MDLGARFTKQDNPSFSQEIVNLSFDFNKDKHGLMGKVGTD
jgi:hypothetical protein